MYVCNIKYAIMCRAEVHKDAESSYTLYCSTCNAKSLLSDSLMVDTDHGLAFWAAGMEWQVGGFWSLSEQLATALVLKCLCCLCGKCISRVPIWTWMRTDSVLPQEKTGGEGGFISVWSINICLCSLVHLLPFVHCRNGSLTGCRTPTRSWQQQPHCWVV